MFKKIFTIIMVMGALFSPLLVQAAPFFKEKEVLYELPAMKDDPVTIQKKTNTHYRVNKIMGTDMWYTRYYKGILDFTQENKKVTVTAFDDNKKYKVIDVEYLPMTIYWNSGMKKWQISTDIYFTQTDAAAAFTDVIFAPPDMNGNPWVLKISDPKLVIKSKS